MLEDILSPYYGYGYYYNYTSISILIWKYSPLVYHYPKLQHTYIHTSRISDILIYVLNKTNKVVKDTVIYMHIVVKSVTYVLELATL